MNERYVQGNIPARKIEGLMAVITIKSSEIHRLNSLATAIWDRCAAPGATVDEIVAGLMEEYDVVEDVLRQDVLDFLSEACEKGLLSVSS
jgi:hypothetical protein